MSKEVQTKQAAELAVAPDAIDAIMGDMQIDSSDLVIPKVLLMQPVSGFVAEEGIAAVGDFRHSTTKEKLGSIVEPLEIIPFHYTKCIDVVSAEEGTSGKLVRKDEFNLANSKLPREDVETLPNGAKQKIRRYTRLDFFCLVPQLMEKGHSLPCVVSFKSTGYRAGGIILTEWQNIITANQQAKAQGRSKDMKLPFARVFALSGTKRTNEKKQTYCIPSIQPAGEATVEQQKVALQWLNTIKTSKVVVDETGEDEVREHVDVADGTGAF